jgi:protein-tyrosine phosphatase
MHDTPLKSNAAGTPRGGWRQIAARLLPRVVIDHARELRTLSSTERRAHVASTMRRLVSRRAGLPRDVTSESAVLFVCYGNIIRSALAEALYRRHSAEAGAGPARVRSAGLSAKLGREADSRAIAAGRALGANLESHRAQPLTKALVDEADVIFIMDRLNEAKLLARFPSARAKVRRLGALAKEGNSDLIEDPYVHDATHVAAAAMRIDRATAALAAILNRRST